MRVGPGAAPLVGRDDELGVLVGAALSGPGGVTLVAGEAGSGKTRLLDEVAGRAAAAGARVLRGHAVPGGGPFRPLAEALTAAAGPALAQDERVAPFRAVLARLLPAWTAGPADGGAGPHLVDPVLVLGEAVGELLGVIAGSGRAPSWSSTTCTGPTATPSRSSSTSPGASRPPRSGCSARCAPTSSRPRA